MPAAAFPRAPSNPTAACPGGGVQILPNGRASQKCARAGLLVYFVIVPTLGSIFISHLWAFSNEDVNLFLPYISDAGGDPPQSALFGFGIITAAISVIIVFCLRYITVSDINKEGQYGLHVSLLNYCLLLLGIGIFFGLVMVAISPTGHLRRDGTWLKPILLPHLLGASVLFLCGLVYLIGNSLLSVILAPRFQNWQVAHARIALSVVDLIACTVTAVKFPEDLMTMKPHPNRPRQYPEGTLYSILGEWSMLASFMLYIYTLKSELDMTVIVIGLQRSATPSASPADQTTAPETHRPVPNTNPLRVRAPP